MERNSRMDGRDGFRSANSDSRFGRIGPSGPRGGDVEGNSGRDDRRTGSDWKSSRGDWKREPPAHSGPRTGGNVAMQDSERFIHPAETPEAMGESGKTRPGGSTELRGQGTALHLGGRDSWDTSSPNQPLNDPVQRGGGEDVQSERRGGVQSGQRARQIKDRNKSSRANHNRKAMADKKRRGGMI